VRNVNQISAPYDEAADWLVRLLLDSARVDLRTAAEVLRATDRVEKTIGEDAENERFERSQEELRRQVDVGVEHVADTAVATLAEHDLGDRRSREAVVTETLAEYDTTATRALALANGSAVEAIEEEALARWSGDLSTRETDRLGVELEWAVRNAATDDAASPRVDVVVAADDSAHEQFRRESTDVVAGGLESATERTVRRATGRALSNFPLGIPITPPPGLWYATVNVWHVEVRGEYPRISVRVPRGSPDRAGGEFVYVRTDSPSRLDVTGDGSPELLGRSTRVSFDTRSDVVVAVPAGPRGVGDVDGQRTEESPGWPQPGSD